MKTGFCAVFACTAVLCSVANGRENTPTEAADSVFSLVEATYRYLHENPELGLKEQAAHDHVVKVFARLGKFELKTVDKLPTAVIAVYDTGRAGPTVALRSELDGRELEKGVVEPADHNPRSKRDGYMHNCGHDAHAAMLLGAAAYVRANESEFAGKLVFVFQPAEEVKGGADDIVADGMLSRLGVQAIFAQHSAPALPVGRFTLTPGPALAGSATFKATLAGKSSHAAAPFEGSDLAVIAAKFIQELAYFPARNFDIANRPVLVSVAKLSTNATSTNLLPSQVEIEGTVRAFEPVVTGNAGSIADVLSARVKALGVAYGIDASLEVRPGAPPTVNSEALFNSVVPQLKQKWGSALETPLMRGMFSEDFAYYTASIPSLYFGLGVMKDSLGADPVHTPEFTIHPDALRAGTALLISLAQTTP